MTETFKEITVNKSGIILATTFEILLPFVLSFLWIKNFKGALSCILIGVLGFMSSVGLESIFGLLVTKIYGKTSQVIYFLSILSPGIFEETGRYIFLNYLLKKNKDKNICVSYGIGHGGIESILVGMTFLSYIFAKEALIKQGALKENITFFICFMSAWERFFSVFLHISLSVLVYKSLRENIIYYYILAIILHDSIDFVALLKAKEILKSVFWTEMIIAVFCSCCAYYAYNLYIKFDENNIEKKNKENIIPLQEKKDL